MNIETLEGTQKKFIVSLHDGDGNALDATLYNWGGGAECGGGLSVDMKVEDVTAACAVLLLQPLVPGPVKGWKGEREEWHYQLRATEKSTGRIFVVLEGEAKVKEWRGATESAGEEIALTAVEAVVQVEAGHVQVDAGMVLGETGPQGESGQFQPYISAEDVNLAALRPNAVHDLGELAVDADLSLLAFEPTATSFVLTAELWFTIGSTILTVTWPTASVWLDGPPALNPSTAYRFVIRREPAGNLILSCAYEYSL